MSSMPVERLQPLAEPLHWAITDTLRAGPRCACQLVDELAVPAPLLSHDMKVLCNVELVHARKLGRRVEYTLDLAALDLVSSSRNASAAWRGRPTIARSEAARTRDP